MTYLLFGLLDAFERGFIGVILILDTLIYGLISSAFRIFMAIAGARLLSSEAYTAIANKIYLIIGVLMLFVLSYGILKAIVNPDEGAKQMGPGLLKKIAIAVVGLAVTPALFNLMYQAQGLILEHDVLAKLFFRSENTESFNATGSVQGPNGSQINYSGNINPDDYVKNIGGAVTATTIWQAFFYPSEDSGLDATEIVADPGDYLAGAVGNGIGCAVSTAGLLITAYTGWTGWGAVIGLLTAGAGALFCTNAIADATAYDQASQITTDEISLADAYVLTSSTSGTANFGIYTVFLDNYLEDGEISYLFGISTLCGAFVLYAFATFSIDMGVRAAKLAYFQVIAPIPLVMQILPGKDSKFKEYTKMVLNTFMEVFIRISVVYIVVYIICHLQDLFSSVDALWGNTDLSTGELMFALAFLIIGLILFCKEAPGFLGKALGVDTGGMKLGLGWNATREKLGKGGVFDAAGVGYGAVTSGVRNFRKGIENKKGFWGTLGSTIAGAGSGAARAAKSQMFGLKPNHSMTWADAKNAGERAAQAATDKRDARDEREALLAQARTDVAAANRELEAARASGDAARIQRAQAAVADAHKRMAEATALGAAITDAGRRIDSWSIGSVSVEQEQAAIKFGKALDSLKGNLREEAYKKDHSKGGAAQLKAQYDLLKSQPINEYAEGWDESSANEEFRRRKSQYEALRSGNAAFDTAHRDLEDKRAELTRLHNSGLRAGNAQYDLAARELETAVTAMNTQMANAGLGGRVSANGSIDFFDGIKIDMAAATAARDAELEALRIAHEAAADAWVQKQANDINSNTARDIQAFLTEHAAYIAKNSNSHITVGYRLDASGNPDYTQPIRETLASVVSTAFGGDAVRGNFVPDATFRGQSSFVLDLKTDISVGGSSYSSVTYKKEGNSYKPYVVDSNGNETAVTSGEYPTYSESDFFTAIKEGVTRGKIKKANAKTAIAIGADKGKTSSVYVAREELAPKNQQIRQNQDKK